MASFEAESIPEVRCRWGIASILTVSMVVVIALVTALTTALDIRRERAIFRDQLEQQGLLLASTLNDVLADPLYFSDLDELHDIARVVNSQAGVSYVYVFRPDGTLLVDAV